MVETGLEIKENDNGIGSLIRKRRIALKISQETLCSGICSKSYLSKIENGSLRGKDSVLRALFERVGISTSYLDTSVGDADNIIRFKTQEVNRARLNKDFDRAWELYDELMVCFDYYSIVNQQRLVVMETMLLYQSGKTKIETKIDSLEKAIRMTVHNYDFQNLPPVMTVTEIIILCYIAIAYGEIEKYEVTNCILEHIKYFIEKSMDDKNQAARLLSGICYDLSKSYGLVGRYDDEIRIAKQGIEQAEMIADYKIIPSCMYNEAWALAKRNQNGDIEEAAKLAEEAYEMCKAKSWSKTLPESLLKLLDEMES